MKSGISDEWEYDILKVYKNGWETINKEFKSEQF